MRITIECDCGNKVVVPAINKKYTQFRDWLNQYYFKYDIESNEGKPKELIIRCDKCKGWITLGVD